MNTGLMVVLGMIGMLVVAFLGASLLKVVVIMVLEFFDSFKGPPPSAPLIPAIRFPIGFHTRPEPAL